MGIPLWDGGNVWMNLATGRSYKLFLRFETSDPASYPIRFCKLSRLKGEATNSGLMILDDYPTVN